MRHVISLRLAIYTLAVCTILSGAGIAGALVLPRWYSWRTCMEAEAELDILRQSLRQTKDRLQIAETLLRAANRDNAQLTRQVAKRGK